RLSGPGLESAKIAIVDDAALTPAEQLAAALERGGLWTILARRVHGRAPDALRVLIKPELAGYTEASPLATEPGLVETLIDLLHDRGYGNVAIAAAADSSALWAENRDVYALSDLLGYRFVTPQGRGYEIVDLADAPDDAVFPLGSALHGTGMSRA